MLDHSTVNMKGIGKYLLIAFGVVVLLIAAGYIYIARPINDGRTPAERRQIADACFDMLHSSLTNEDYVTKMDDPRIPEIIRVLHPHHIEVTPNFAVAIQRAEWPQAYFFARLPGNTNTWVLSVWSDGDPLKRFGGGPREICRIEHD